MINEKKPYITFGSQMGDEFAADVVQPHLIELRKLLNKYCNTVYSPEINEFALVARVSGKIWYWDFEGCQKLRFNRKEKYLTIDIGIPENKWKDADSLSIRKYIFDNLQSGLLQIIKRLKKEKNQIDEECLLLDLEKVEKVFLNI